eukprot:4764325-Ditylum_brightwellii.AAC.1
MEYHTDPIKAWKAVRTLEKGLSHHHSECCTNPLPCDLTGLDRIFPCNDFTHLANKPSLAEVTATLCQMANGKAPGPSSVTSDALKAMVWTEHQLENESGNDDVEYLAPVIHVMILEFWTGHLNFQYWESGTLAPVPQKGDLSNLNKWQPVCLLETTYKVLVIVLAFCINPIMRDNGLEEQCGNLSSKGCQDANFSLRIALHLHHEHNLPMH